MIRVNPGSYEISKFIAANAFGGLEGEKDLSGWPYKTTVKVEPGKVYYIGDFVAEFEVRGGNMIWSIDSYKNDFENVNNQLDKEYSGFLHMKKIDLFKEKANK